MNQYNILKIKLSDSQLNLLKTAIKNETEVTLNLSSDSIRNPNDETSFPDELLLTDTQVSKICQAFANGSSANIKFSKTQLSKILLLGGFLLGPVYILIHLLNQLKNYIHFLNQN